MNERRLLERIADTESGAAQIQTARAEVLLRSVVTHLRCILNTRQGSVPLDPLFGVPDFTNLAGGLGAGSVRDIEVAIRQVVTRYEPRVRQPQVTLRADAGDPMALYFDLDGRLDIDGQEIPLHLSTVVHGSGQVRVPDVVRDN